MRLGLSRRSGSSSGLLGRLGARDHLERRHDLLLELGPLNDRVVELDLWQVDEHSGDLGRFLLAAPSDLRCKANSFRVL